MNDDTMNDDTNKKAEESYYRSSSILAAGPVRAFRCLEDQCPDTCCRGWSMQVEDRTFQRYAETAPELLDAVAEDATGIRAMRLDHDTGYCVKLDGGLCSIHRDYGPGMLGDACYFYPRVTRSLGEQLHMTATLSCPEIARLSLMEPDIAGESPQAMEMPRIPQTINDYLLFPLDAAHAMAVHEAFLQAALDESRSPELSLACIVSAAQSIERLPVEQWQAASGFFLKSAEGRLPAPESVPEDPFNLLHALCGMIVSARRKPSPRLMEVIGIAEHALHATLDWQHVSIHLQPDSAARFARVKEAWEPQAAQFAPVFRRWIAAQLSLALFPFSGPGGSLKDRATVIGVRYATFRLMLMCRALPEYGELSEQAIVQAAQSLSRVLDHLAAYEYSMQVYSEAGWTRESRLRGLFHL